MALLPFCLALYSVLLPSFIILTLYPKSYILNKPLI